MQYSICNTTNLSNFLMQIAAFFLIREEDEKKSKVQIVESDDDLLKNNKHSEKDDEEKNLKLSLLADTKDEKKINSSTSNWTQLRLILHEADVVVCALLYGIFTFSVLAFVEIFALWVITDAEVGGLVICLPS